jgi:hypothetical protein
MSEKTFQDSWALFTRASGAGVLLRILVLLSPLAALACLRLAAGRTLIVVDIAVMVLVVCAVVLPDSHFGLLVVTIFGGAWLVSIRHTVSPWSLATALALLVFHTALAASSIAAPSAVWSRALRRRWSSRAGVLALSCVATWLVVAAVNVYDVASSSVLVIAALVVMSLAGLWARDVTLHSGALRGRDRDARP